MHERDERGYFHPGGEDSLFPGHKTRNLSGRTLLASAFPYEPFFDHEVTAEGEVRQNGLELVMAKELAKSLNARILVAPPSNGSWGRDLGTSDTATKRTCTQTT